MGVKARRALETASLVLIAFGLFSLVQPWLLQLYNFSIVFLGIGGGIWLTLGYIPSNPKLINILKTVIGIFAVSLFFIVVSILVVPYLVSLL